MELTILLDAPRARTTDDFLLRDLPGTSGRLDVVCRVLIATFRSIPSLASSIIFRTVLGGPPNPPLELSVDNPQPNQIPDSELSCAIVLKTLFFLLRTKTQGFTHQWSNFHLQPRSFQDALSATIQPPTQCIYLVEEGELVEQVALNLNEPILVVLGDDQGLSSEHEALLMQHPVQKVSMGTRSLLGSQVVSLFLLELAHRIETNTPGS